MLKNFPPKKANKSELVFYQKHSDELLKPVSSTVSATWIIPQTQSDEKYDITKLKNVTNVSSEITDMLASSLNESRLAEEDVVLEKESPDSADAKASIESGMKSGKMSKDSILAMIFKIIPIGINIVKRIKTIAVGFKESSTGIVNLTKNLAILSTVIGADSIEFVTQFFIYLFKLINRGVSLISNFPTCVFFYLIHILILFSFSVIISILFIADVFLMIKYFTGISCIEIFILLLSSLSAFFKSTFASSSTFNEYKEYILKTCYRCDEAGETDGFNRVSSRMFDNIFIKMPKKIGGPIGEIITGIGHIISFLDLR